MRFSRLLLVLPAVLATWGCDSQVAEPRPGDTAHIRLSHGAATTSPLNLKVDGRIVLQNVSATQISAYAEVSAGTRTLEVTLASGQTLFSRNATLAKDGEYTLLVSGSSGRMEHFISADTAFTPSTTKVKIRVIHTARHAPPLDVYLTTPGADLAGETPVVEPFEFNPADSAAFPDFLIRDPGQFQVRFTADGTTNVLLDTGPFAGAAGQVITVVLSHDGNNDLVVRILDETPGGEPDWIAIRVNHAAPAVPTVALHIIDPGQDLAEPHLTIAPFNYGLDSSTVTFLLPPNNQSNLDFEVVITEQGNLTVLATSGPVSAPVYARKLAVFQPAAGGGLEVVVSDQP